MSETRTSLIRKIIPLISITGCMGGATAAAMEWSGASYSYLMTGIYVLLTALAGTLTGYFILKATEARGKDIIKKNFKDEILRFNQPLYLLGLAAAVAAFVLNHNAGTASGIAAAVFYGLTFSIGISNGIFDYKESVTKNLLMLPIIFIGFSFVYGYYISGTDAASDMAWLYGSVYLFSYLLFLNRMQLNSIIFFRKAVNIEDSRKIRVYNDWLIVLFYIVYLVMFRFRRILKVSYDAILAVFGWLLVMMEKLMDLLLADPETEMIDEVVEKEEIVLDPRVERPFLETLLKIIMYVIVAVVGVAGIIFIGYLIYRLFKLIKEKLSGGFSKSMTSRKVEFAEYEEENEIVKNEKNKDAFSNRRRKFRYNLKKLNEIPLAGDKIRYVYGFVLERMYGRQLDISETDTPEEILGKIKKHRNSEKLMKMGFDEFTEKYRAARYGGRDVEPEEDLEKKGADFEKGVSSIQVDKKDSL